jgi:hypothetical protein
MNPLFVTFITAVVSSIASAIIASIVALIRNKTSKNVKQLEKEQAEMDALKIGMRALLWQEINDIYMRGKHAGGLSVDQRHNLENVYAAYHGLGGNGTGTRLHDEAMELSVLTD